MISRETFIMFCLYSVHTIMRKNYPEYLLKTSSIKYMLLQWAIFFKYSHHKSSLLLRKQGGETKTIDYYNVYALSFLSLQNIYTVQQTSLTRQESSSNIYIVVWPPPPHCIMYVLLTNVITVLFSYRNREPVVLYIYMYSSQK